MSRYVASALATSLCETYIRLTQDTIRRERSTPTAPRSTPIEDETVQDPRSLERLDDRLSSDLVARAGALAVTAPVVFVLVWWGPRWAFAALLVAAVAVAASELAALLEGPEGSPSRSLFVVGAPLLLVGGSLAGLVGGGPVVLLIHTVSLALIAFVAWPLFWSRPIERPGPSGVIALAYMGLLPVPLLLLHVVAGPLWTVVALLTTWGADVVTYLFGRFAGGPVLLPEVNERKTLGGAVCAIAIVTATVGLLFRSLDAPGPLIAATVVALPATALNQLGDLAESRLKRRAGVDDSGSVARAHGGMLDVLDGLLFAGPYLYLVAPWVPIP